MIAGVLAAVPAPYAAPEWSPGRCKVEPAASPGRGRGVFAVAPVDAGEVIERACTIPLTSEQCDRLEDILPLGDHYFRHPEDAEQGLLLLGLSSLVNHAAEPNAEVRFEHSADLGWVAVLFCRRPIAAGEEVTRRYLCPPWFGVK